MFIKQLYVAGHGSFFKNGLVDRYKEDNISMLGWNMYMTPQEADQGLCLQNYPENVSDSHELDGYRDITEFDVFKNCKTI